MAEETKKQKYIGISVLEDAQPMTLGQAIEDGIVVDDAETAAEEKKQEGYKLTFSDGVSSWMSKEAFEDNYSKLSDADAKMIDKLDDSPVKTFKLALKLRGLVNEIEKKQWSFKRLGSEVVKVFGVNLDEINNDTDL